MSSNSEFDLEVLKSVLKRDKKTILKVVSDSMSPLIKVGESIEVALLEAPEQLKPFDIILFEQARRLNCHFLAKTDYINNLFITKSLKNPSASDYPLETKQILGIVTSKKISFFTKIGLLIRS